MDPNVKFLLGLSALLIVAASYFIAKYSALNKTLQSVRKDRSKLEDQLIYKFNALRSYEDAVILPAFKHMLRVLDRKSNPLTEARKLLRQLQALADINGATGLNSIKYDFEKLGRSYGIHLYFTVHTSTERNQVVVDHWKIVLSWWTVDPHLPYKVEHTFDVRK